jgi:hypothetical protein
MKRIIRSSTMEAHEGLRWRVGGWASNLGEIWNPGDA